MKQLAITVALALALAACAPDPYTPPPLGYGSFAGALAEGMAPEKVVSIHGDGVGEDETEVAVYDASGATQKNQVRDWIIWYFASATGNAYSCCYSASDQVHTDDLNCRLPSNCSLTTGVPLFIDINHGYGDAGAKWACGRGKVSGVWSPRVYCATGIACFSTTSCPAGI